MEQFVAFLKGIAALFAFTAVLLLAMEAIDPAFSPLWLPPGVAQAAQPSNTAAAEADKSPATSRTAKPRD